MKDALLLGLGRGTIPLPRLVWRQLAKAGARRTRASLRFMSEDHHRVREHVVAQLPRSGAPLSPESIAAALGIAVGRVRVVLDELEKRLTFVFRNDRGEVTWAYPVTVEQTPHHARFSTGEEAYSP